MPDQQSRQRANPQAEAAMLRHRQAIERARVIDDYAYDIDALLDLKLGFMSSN